MNRSKKVLLFLIFHLSFSFFLRSESGHQLWLRPVDAHSVTVELGGRPGATQRLAADVLSHSWQGDSKATIKLRLIKDRSLKPDGFRLHTGEIQATSETGLLYGAYEYIRRQRMGKRLDGFLSNPAYQHRILNHWDNLNGTIERGYAGHSIFWRREAQPTVTESDRALWREYAAANASIGINGTVLNNVNASPEMLSLAYLQKTKAIAEALRPFGVRVYLSINYASPMRLSGLKTADPLDPKVQAWWRDKIAEIYALIPDFGGFLVKANSEGQPGPMDYGRTHVEGANMLADAIKPFNGLIMWRAFVYDPAGGSDRATQAYDEFMPFDGKFRDNVIIQVKNGPVDFQPREPFSPLFGAMKQTSVMPELQITQEYLGFSFQLVYLAPMWTECLQSDTYQMGVGSTVARCTDGQLYPQTHTAIAGVANIGLDDNWCGHPFAQANWYAFGRLAWDHALSGEVIAEEWIQQTFTAERSFVDPVKTMMMASREAAVNYMMPLGLHHLFAWGHHYGPEPWCNVAGARADWLPSYYHRASEEGIGFDRTVTGSNAVKQYQEPLRSRFASIESCPDELLLWFHHVPWQHRMQSGETLWNELCIRYDRGVQEVRSFQKVWDRMESFVDSDRFKEVQSRLRRQARDAQWWKDACLLYFQTYSNLPIPTYIERPVQDLEEMKQIKFDWTHHN